MTNKKDLSCSEFREHDKRIDEAFGRMVERQGQPSYNRKPEILPQLYSALICADHKVELHCAEAGVFSLLLRMQAHPSGDTSSRCVRCRHVAAVADVRSASALIGAQVVGTDHHTIFFRHKHLIAGREPVRQRLITRDISRQGVGLAGTQDRLENEPGAIGVGCACGADIDHTLIISFGRSPKPGGEKQIPPRRYGVPHLSHIGVPDELVRWGGNAMGGMSGRSVSVMV